MQKKLQDKAAKGPASGSVTDAFDQFRHASAYNRSLIEASLDPLVTINPDGTISDVNAATVKITGFSREELIGTDFSEYFTEPERAKAGYETGIPGRVGYRITSFEIRHRNGHDHSCSLQRLGLSGRGRDYRRSVCCGTGYHRTKESRGGAVASCCHRGQFRRCNHR